MKNIQWAKINVGLLEEDISTSEDVILRMKSFFTINLKHLAIIAVYLLVIHGLLALIGRRYLPYCAYFKQDASKLLRLDQMRRETGIKAIKDLQEKSVASSMGQLFANPKSNELCISIMSIKRKNSDYLSTVVAALLTRIPWSEGKKRIRMQVHNLELPPTNHTEAISLKSLIKVIPQKYRSGLGKEDLAGNESPFVREFIDYINVLRDNLEDGCKYSLILEDDALVAPGMTEMLFKELKRIEDTFREPWIELKLFVTLKWTAWFFGEGPVILDVFSITYISLFASSLTLLLAKLLSWSFSTSNKRPSRFRKGPSTKIFNIYSLILLFVGYFGFIVLLGRHHTLPWSKKVHSHSMGASNVAVLYPRKGMELLADYMESLLSDYREGRLDHLPAKDLLFRKLRTKLKGETGINYHELLLLPSLFQHIGMKSSLGKVVDPEYFTHSYHYQFDDLPITFDPSIEFQ